MSGFAAVAVETSIPKFPKWILYGICSKYIMHVGWKSGVPYQMSLGSNTKSH